MGNPIALAGIKGRRVNSEECSRPQQLAPPPCVYEPGDPSRRSILLAVHGSEIESPETTAFPMYCTWETFGLPGMKVMWKYSLEYARQLGNTAFRHGKLECTFDTIADRQRFTGIWERVIGKVPVFESLE
jgi:hypothetical protein